MTGRWFSPGPPVPSTNKTDRHDITVIQKKCSIESGVKYYKPTIYIYTELQDTSEIIKKKYCVYGQNNKKNSINNIF